MTAKLYPVIMAADVARARDFYAPLFGLEAAFESDWYIALISGDGMAEIGFIQREHESVPEGFRAAPAGTLVTVETPNVDAVWERARRLGMPVRLELRDEVWGQRHFMLEDPDGLLVDVVSPFQPSGETNGDGHDAGAP